MGRLVEDGTDHGHQAQAQVDGLGLGEEIAVDGRFDGVNQLDLDCVGGIGRGRAPSVKRGGNDNRALYVVFFHMWYSKESLSSVKYRPRTA